jgi:hypothetical protein
MARAVLLVAGGCVLVLIVLIVHSLVLVSRRLAQIGPGSREALQRDRHGEQERKQQTSESTGHQANSTAAFFSV